MEDRHKCGYCGWLLNASCENLLEHQCLRNIYKEGVHDLVTDNAGVLTIVEKNSVMPVALSQEDANVSTLGGSWEEIFIKHVQDRTPLYDLSTPVMERSNAKKQQLWNEIANIYGGRFSAQDLQKKWKYLRDCYIRAKRKVNTYKPSGSEACPPPDPGFRYFQLMQFIDDSVSQQQTVSSVRNEATPSTSGASSPMASPTESFTPSSSKKRKADDKSLEKGILEALTTTPAPDGVDGFLIRLGESMRRMPYKDRSLLEIKILQLVYDTENKLSEK